MKQLLVGALLALLLASPAGAWVEAESENFILRGDLKEADARRIVQELESFRTNILGLLGAGDVVEPIKVPILTVRNAKEMKRVTGTDTVAGVYNANLEGPAFVMSTKGGFRRGSRARSIAFHEYVHHLISTYTTDHYPRWYNEGYAEFLSSYSEKDEMFSVGAPHDGHGHFLRKVDWFPTSTMLGSVRHYPFSYGRGRGDTNARAQFYAQSWLMVHYLQNDAGRAERFSDYIAGLNRGEDSVEAFTKAYGVGPEAFTEEVRGYLKGNRFAVKSFPLAVDTNTIAVEVRDIPDATGLVHIAEAAAVFSGLGGDGDASVETALERAEGRFGESARLHGVRAARALQREAFAEARIHAARALQLEPDSLDARRLAGIVEVRAKAGYNEAADMEAGREHLRAVLARKPSDPSANYHLALSHVVGGWSSDGILLEAKAAAAKALAYYRDARYADSNLSILPVLAFAGFETESLPILRNIEVWGRSPSTRRAASLMIEQVEDRIERLR